MALPRFAQPRLPVPLLPTPIVGCRRDCSEPRRVDLECDDVATGMATLTSSWPATTALLGSQVAQVIDDVPDVVV